MHILMYLQMNICELMNCSVLYIVWTHNWCLKHINCILFCFPQPQVKKRQYSTVYAMLGGSCIQKLILPWNIDYEQAFLEVWQ